MKIMIIIELSQRVPQNLQKHESLLFGHYKYKINTHFFIIWTSTERYKTREMFSEKLYTWNNLILFTHKSQLCLRYVSYNFSSEDGVRGMTKWRADIKWLCLTMVALRFSSKALSAASWHTAMTWNQQLCHEHCPHTFCIFKKR